MVDWLKQGFRQMQPGVYHRVECYGEKLMVCKVVFEQGAIVPPHAHPHEQITHVISGRIEFDIAGARSLLQAGDSCLMAPDAPHGATCLEEAVVLDIFTPLREDFIRRCSS
jgi:quercetin dioxygenase-like cupin family protein